MSTDVPDDVLPLLGHLARTLGPRRRALLALRARRQSEADDGDMPAPRANTQWVRRGTWICTATGPHADVLVARGLPHTDPRVAMEGSPISASLYDLATHLHASIRATDRAPCVALPEMAGLEEAFWLRDALDAIERALELPANSVRVAVAIETVPAAFEADEILFALRHRAVSLQCAAATYTRTLLELGRAHPDRCLPDLPALPDGPPWLAALGQHLARVAARRAVAPVGWLRSARSRSGDDAVEHLLDLPDGPRTLAGVRRLVHDIVQALAGAGNSKAWTDRSFDHDTTVGCAVVRHWVQHEARLDDGRTVGAGLLADVLADAHATLHQAPGADRAVQRFRELVFGAR